MRVLDPWERQPYDTDESWPVFQAYRDQKPPRRGLLVSFRGRPVDPIKVARWFREHFWGERVAEWDRHLDAIRVSEMESALAKSTREAMADHVQLVEQAKEIASRELEKLLATVKDSAVEVLKPRDLTRLLDSTIKLDRLIRGETTENVNVDGPDLSHLTDEQLSALDSMLGNNADPSIH